MILAHQIRFTLQQTPEEAVAGVLKKLGLSKNNVVYAHIHKISVDARHKPPLLVATVAIGLQDELSEVRMTQKHSFLRHVSLQEDVVLKGTGALKGSVIVCGMGPSGLFAALELAKNGFNPIVIERGANIEQRRIETENFSKTGILNEETNIQFGEGGAGTFSDGKLTTRITNPLCQNVINHLLQAGAPEEIAYSAKPHIGTDLLQDVFINLRKQLISLGASVHFNTKLTGIITKNGAISGIETTKGEMPCAMLIMAMGHSARDTVTALHGQGVFLEAKPFAVGFRIEHLQSEIDKGLYHEAAGHSALPAGEYALKTSVKGRGVYTFCMCPGGNVVAAASQEGMLVTNGMSAHARNGKNANAAVVAAVSASDFGTEPLSGLEFQRKLEKAAFAAGGGNFVAPCETQGSFLKGEGKLCLDRVQPTYSRGVAPANIAALLPKQITAALQEGLLSFEKRIKEFGAPDAVITGLETRTSSPVRMVRTENLQSANIAGLLPCGEGAGYAGGIMSAAVDGMRVARKIIEEFKP